MSDKIFVDGLLAGRVAFVTGGGTGITGGVARALAEAGAKVALVSRKLEHLEPAAQLINDAGGEAIAVACDVREPAQVEAAIAATVEKFGHLDIVVNGAAGNFLCLAKDLSANGFGTVVDIDLKGTFNVSRAAFEHLKKSRGSILNISATLHYGATPMQLHVSSAKAGVDALTRNLAAEWGRYGIRTNGIAPGPIAETEGMARLSTPEMREKLKQMIPIGRLGTIRDIEQSAVFLCSEAASFINGHTIIVDGGLWLLGTRLG